MNTGVAVETMLYYEKLLQTCLTMKMANTVWYVACMAMQQSTVLYCT